MPCVELQYHCAGTPVGTTLYATFERRHTSIPIPHYPRAYLRESEVGNKVIVIKASTSIVTAFLNMVLTLHLRTVQQLCVLTKASEFY